MGLKKGMIGCCSGCPTGTRTFTLTVQRCGGQAFAGVSVELSQGGSLLASGVTNASGVYASPAVFSSGTVDYTGTTTEPRYGTLVGSGTIPGLGNGSKTDKMPAAPGYVCTLCCPDPIAEALTLTDSNGSHSLTWNGTNLNWFFCYTKSVTSRPDCLNTVDTGTVSCPIQFALSCSSGAFRLLLYYAGCSTLGISANAGAPAQEHDCSDTSWPNDVKFSVPGGATPPGIGTVSGGTTCSPFLLDFGTISLPTGDRPFPGSMINGSVTISE